MCPGPLLLSSSTLSISNTMQRKNAPHLDKMCWQLRVKSDNATAAVHRFPCACLVHTTIFRHPVTTPPVRTSAHRIDPRGSAALSSQLLPKVLIVLGIPSLQWTLLQATVKEIFTYTNLETCRTVLGFFTTRGKTTWIPLSSSKFGSHGSEVSPS
jgi:hypothetical protein